MSARIHGLLLRKLPEAFGRTLVASAVAQGIRGPIDFAEELLEKRGLQRLRRSGFAASEKYC